MKKRNSTLIVLLLVLACFLSCCNNREETSITDNSTESNTNNDSGMVETPDFSVESYDEYLRIIEDVGLSSKILAFDYFKELGDFDYFVALSGDLKKSSQYMYSFDDKSGCIINVKITDLIKRPETMTIYDELDSLEFSSLKKDLRTIEGDATAIVRKEGISYTYLHGKLMSISFEINSIQYLISGTPHLNNYPEGRDTLFSKILDRDQSTDILNRIKSEIEKTGDG